MIIADEAKSGQNGIYFNSTFIQNRERRKRRKNKKKKRAVRGCVGCFRDLQEQGAVPILKDFTRVCKFLIIRFNKKITIEPTASMGKESQFLCLGRTLKGKPSHHIYDLTTYY